MQLEACMLSYLLNVSLKQQMRSKELLFSRVSVPIRAS